MMMSTLNPMQYNVSSLDGDMTMKDRKLYFILFNY